MQSGDGLKIERDGAVTVITLNRPARRNTIDVDTAVALGSFLRSATLDQDVRAIVITGAGEKDYCTGGDIAANPNAAKEWKPIDFRYAVAPIQDMFKALWEVEKPVVTAVNGTVAGIGWMFALLGDLVVAAAGTRWTHVFTRRGMIPHAGDPYYLPRLIPYHRLSEIALLSEPVTTETLHGWGLVNRLVPREQVLPTALELAKKLAEGPTRSLGMTKRLYRRSLDAALDDMYKQEADGLALIATTDDRTEGVKSFVEGRPARFTGN
jgi:2-(1,2-epoxy-1,2-dihydrophenyl)acetyl-CoA isomerase